MFLLMGMKVKLKALDHGTFHCPRCAADRAYTRFEARRWFTLFFVPVIPLGRIGTLVRCDSCGGQFDEQALSAPTSADRVDTTAAAMRAVVASFVALTDDDATVRAGMEAARAWGTPGYGDTDLTWDRQSGAAQGARQLVTTAAPALDALTRERFLTDTARVALADGPMPPAEEAFVRDVGGWLGLTPANIDGVLARV